MPVFFRENGLTNSEIGTLLAVGPLAAILSQPIMGFISDKYKSIKMTLLICLIGSILISLILIQVSSFIGYVIVLFLFFSFVSSVNPLGDSLAKQTAEEENSSFGYIRMWGSLGFGVSALVVGYILSLIGVSSIFFLILACLVITFLIALSLENPTKVSKKATILDLVKMGTEPKLFIFLFFVMFISITHRTNDNFLGLYILELGGDESYIGVATFIGVATECIVLATGAFWFRRFHETTFIMIAGILYCIRWLLMAIITEPSVVLVLQLLHGVTFGILFLSAFQYTSKILPSHLQATGHVLFYTILFGVSAIIGTLAGGAIIDYFSMQVLYFLMSILAAIGVGLLGIYRLKFSANSKKTQNESVLKV